jgi:N-acetylneuraminic acid mutarotase
MKKIILSISFLFLSMFVFAQNWTWMKGPTIINTNGIYGTMGISSPTTYPGSRHGCPTWVDASGRLWVFGGEGHPAIGPLAWLNDLWRYDPVTNEWTWVDGSTASDQPGIYGTKGLWAPGNFPGAREFASCWQDAAGMFWMFGGDGWDAFGNFGSLNDLWKYDPVMNQWTWISGSNVIDQNGAYGSQTVSSPTNIPGGRINASTVMDAAGNMYLFGGIGFDAVSSLKGYLCDLWKYNPVNNEWTWMKGTNTKDQNGFYGTMGISSPINFPGGRELSPMWVDASGNFWMFGGGGFASTGPQGYLNDVWKYLIATNRWVWISGSNMGNVNGVYGTMGTASTSNYPGARTGPAWWKDNAGDFWIFGGVGFPRAGGVGRLNDMFKYNSITNEWTWMKGSDTISQNGTYGAMGTTTSSNTPGSRYYNSFWKDLSGNFWIIGGNGYPASGGVGNLCDLWKFNLSCTPDNLSSFSEVTLCSGENTTLTATSSGTGAISWYASPTSTTAIASGSAYVTPNLTAAGSQTVYMYYAEAAGCSGPRAPVSVTVNPLPVVTATTSNIGPCAGQTTTLTANGASTYSWSTGASGSSINVVANFPVTYTVIGIDSMNCKNSAIITQSVTTCAGIVNYNGSDIYISVYPNPNKGQFNIIALGLNNSASVIFYNMLGQKIAEQKLQQGENKIELVRGPVVYFYKISEEGKVLKTGKVVIE